MPSSQLKPAERAIQAIRDQAELPPEAADALQELVDCHQDHRGSGILAGRKDIIRTQPNKWNCRTGK